MDGIGHLSSLLLLLNYLLVIDGNDTYKWWQFLNYISLTLPSLLLHGNVLKDITFVSFQVKQYSHFFFSIVRNMIYSFYCTALLTKCEIIFEVFGLKSTELDIKQDKVPCMGDLSQENSSTSGSNQAEPQVGGILILEQFCHWRSKYGSRNMRNMNRKKKSYHETRNKIKTFQCETRLNPTGARGKSCGSDGFCVRSCWRVRYRLFCHRRQEATSEWRSSHEKTLPLSTIGSSENGTDLSTLSEGRLSIWAAWWLVWAVTVPTWCQKQVQYQERDRL